MSPRPFVALFIVLALAATDSAAAGRAGELEIRTGTAGQPCFTISEREELRSGAPDFHAIAVTDGKASMWSMVMPSQRTFPVSFRMCIPYAGRLPVLPQTPAAELKTGRVYDVLIESRWSGPAGARSYRGRFCLVHDAGGKAAQVRAVRSGHQCQR